MKSMIKKIVHKEMDKNERPIRLNTYLFTEGNIYFGDYLINKRGSAT